MIFHEPALAVRLWAHIEASAIQCFVQTQRRLLRCFPNDRVSCPALRSLDR